MNRWLVALSFVVLAQVQARADCAVSATGADSPNGQWKLALAVGEKSKVTFTLSTWDGARKVLTKKSEGPVEGLGHHLVGSVADDGGHFVVLDKYAGLLIYTGEGKLVKKLVPSDLLTKEEQESRPGKWECHPEGEWSSGPCTFGAKNVKVVLTNGRAVELALATGAVAPTEWVLEGTCATPDNVKAHGTNNCLGLKWTCARCKKEQDGLVWRICGACCKELGVCVVCNKKVAAKEAPDGK